MMKLPQLKPWWRWLRDITIIVVLFLGVRSFMTPEIPDGIKPDIFGTTIKGERVSLESYRGKASLIYVWGTWCPVCKLTSGSVDKIARDYPVITLAINSGSDESIRTFLDERGYAFATINDESGQILRQLGAQAVPLFLVINPVGEIVAIETGFTSGLGLRVRLWWAAR